MNWPVNDTFQSAEVSEADKTLMSPNQIYDVGSLSRSRSRIERRIAHPADVLMRAYKGHQATRESQYFMYAYDYFTERRNTAKYLN